MVSAETSHAEYAAICSAPETAMSDQSDLDGKPALAAGHKSKQAKAAIMYRRHPTKSQARLLPQS